MIHILVLEDDNKLNKFVSAMLRANGFEVFSYTKKEFNIIFKLLSYPKQTFTRAQLKDEFWGVEVKSTLRSVDVYINKLRDKFANCRDFEIVTVHGLGYKAVLK